MSVSQINVSMLRYIYSAIILSCSYFFWLNLNVFSFAYVCFFFCLFVFFWSCFLSHRSQSTWVSGVNTWFRFYSFYAMLTSWLLSVHLFFFHSSKILHHPLPVLLLPSPECNITTFFVPWTEGTHACSYDIWIDCSVRGRVTHTDSNFHTSSFTRSQCLSFVWDLLCFFIFMILTSVY